MKEKQGLVDKLESYVLVFVHTFFNACVTQYIWDLASIQVLRLSNFDEVRLLHILIIVK